MTDKPSIQLTPDFKDAMADLNEIDRLQSDHPLIAIELRRLIDEGTPLLRPSVDWQAAVQAGYGIVRYELHERLATCLAACRVQANNVNSSGIESGIHDLLS